MARLTVLTPEQLPNELRERAGVDPLDPANNSPIVVALCADAAQGITGQVFHVFGGSVNMLTAWSPGELFSRDQGWSADELLGELLVDRFGAAKRHAAPALVVERDPQPYELGKTWRQKPSSVFGNSNADSVIRVRAFGAMQFTVTP